MHIKLRNGKKLLVQDTAITGKLRKRLAMSKNPYVSMKTMQSWMGSGAYPNALSSAVHYLTRRTMELSWVDNGLYRINYILPNLPPAGSLAEELLQSHTAVAMNRTRHLIPRHTAPPEDLWLRGSKVTEAKEEPVYPDFRAPEPEPEEEVKREYVGNPYTNMDKNVRVPDRTVAPETALDELRVEFGIPGELFERVGKFRHISLPVWVMELRDENGLTFVATIVRKQEEEA